MLWFVLIMIGFITGNWWLLGIAFVIDVVRRVNNSARTDTGSGTININANVLIQLSHPEGSYRSSWDVTPRHSRLA